MHVHTHECLEQNRQQNSARHAGVTAAVHGWVLGRGAVLSKLGFKGLLAWEKAPHPAGSELSARLTTGNVAQTILGLGSQEDSPGRPGGSFKKMRKWETG